ncbi:MAG: family 78 glycoside hydrolase catalytic domain [Armatimonas sp.]
MPVLALPVSALTPERLRCEYRENPLAVDGEHPRLSWIVTNGQAQTAYQIQAGSKPGASDLWDTGKVASEETLHHPYEGKALRSGQQVFWRVGVWDEAGKLTWSKTASFTKGIGQNDWKASWIQAPVPGAAAMAAGPSLEKASWIWKQESGAQPAKGIAWFTLKFDRPAGAKVQIAITADDAYQIQLNGKDVSGATGSSWRESQVHDLTEAASAGANTLRIRVENGEVGFAGLLANLRVGTREYPTNIDWVAGEGERVKVLGPYGMQPWGQPQKGSVNAMTPPPHFRGNVVLEKPIARAILYATALGVYELGLNGKGIDNDVLSPGWTEYRKRVHYVAYDVTKKLKQGENTLEAQLGDGWYASYLAFTGRRHYYGGDPKLKLQLAVTYTDGTQATFGTGRDWKWANGGIKYADMLMGVSEDTRVTPTDWKAVQVAEDPGILVEAHPAEPIRPTVTIKAINRTEPKPGVYVYNIGQNLSGWAKITVTGKPGQTITVRHAERLNPDGTAYFTNLRAAKATDTYILKGGKQTLEPKFTFHGFQYVEITGCDTPPATKDVAGVAVNSHMESTLAIDTSNPLLNKLVQNIDWGFRGNALDVPTDCPQRDERAGWTGDAQVFAKTALFTRGSGAFFSKWLVDLIEDSQREDGALGDVAPYINAVGHGNAAWEDSGVIVTYRMWEMQNDTQVIKDHWAGLTRYMEHLAKSAPDGIRGPGSYGDWLLLDGPQRSDVHGTAYYARCADLMAQMASEIGKPAEAAKYRDTAVKVRQAFIEKFVTSDGQVQDGGKTSQTFYALALDWNLVPTNLRAQTAMHLERLLKNRGGKLATGFIGTPLLLPALAGSGREAMAADLLLSETYPSWLYQVKLGSTTMWERWDGWTPEKGFQDAGMNSFNHYWLGCVGEWLVTGVSGIDTDGPGWKKITLKPYFAPKLNKVSTTYDSVRGRIVSRWERQKNGVVRWEVEVPANTVATAYLPGGKTETLKPGKHTLLSPAP